jgi:S-adenosylmethionine:tRNA ribosyltransferase-isomerase
MDVRAFDFDLPSELIAQAPAGERTAARLLRLDRETGALTRGVVADLPRLLRAGDLVVVNNTRVFPARLIGRRVPSGGAVECLLIGRREGTEEGRSGDGVGTEWGRGRDGVGTESRAEAEVGSEVWEALMHPGQKLKPGAQVVFDGSHTLHGVVLERRFFGRRLIRLWTADGAAVTAAVDAIGHVPLPPYIKRADRAEDRERYQTVFARERGSVAAPTAGLHVTASLLKALAARGVEVVEVTLHVGYGTFQPVRVDRVEAHRLHAEQYEIGAATAATVNRALDEGRRIIAVGTTTTRTLEAVAAVNEGRLTAGRGSTDLFIYPGFAFRVVGGLLTNFHVPQSSLLMLVSAFGGRERVLDCYRTAVAERYRFYSYGDAMLIS